MKPLILTILSLLLLITSALQAQHTVIKGRAVGEAKPTGKVTLYKHTDYITENLYERAEAEIQGDTFEIVLKYHDHTEPYILNNKNRTTKIFLEPDSEYEILLGQQGFVIIKEPASQLNKKLMDYGNGVFDFMARASKIADPKAFADFKTSMFMKYYSEDNEFFNAYYKYDLKIKELFFGATGQYWMDKESFDKAERNYLTETEIRLRHPKWGEYFKNHVSYRSRFCKLQRIDCCDPKASCQQTAPFEEASLFANDTLRELATVVAISNKIEANQGGDKLDLLLEMRAKLDSMEENASVGVAKELATQYKERYDLFGIGSRMPKISLTNAAGNTVNVNELEGKYILLDFWALWCKPCLKEMQFLSTLPDRMQDKLVIVSISVDKSEENVWKFVEEKSYDWLFLHNGENPSLPNKLLVNVYPSYFLFSPEGKLVYRPSSISTEWQKIKGLVEGE